MIQAPDPEVHSPRVPVNKRHLLKSIFCPFEARQQSVERGFPCKALVQLMPKVQDNVKRVMEERQAICDSGSEFVDKRRGKRL